MLCTLDRIVYEKDSYMVASFLTDAEIPAEAQSKFRSGAFTAVGYHLPRSSAIQCELDGTWQKSKYGYQLAVESCQQIVPKTADGICAYLSSGLIKGVGEKTARLIVNTFGCETLDIIEQHPERLTEVKGISEKKVKQIAASYVETKNLREIVTFLAPYGITVKKCAEISRTFGSDAMKILRTSPFSLCQISGFGFKTVDEIARKAHCLPGDPMRIQGALRYVLEQSMLEGHLYLTKEDLRERAHALLNEENDDTITLQQIHRQLCMLVRNNSVTHEDGCIYLPYNYKNEVACACALAYRIMLPEEAKSDTEITEIINVLEQELGVVLAKEQRDGVMMSMKHNVSIITGGPGTGKTTTLRLLLAAYKRLYPDKTVALAAPTGRAARRMEESTKETAVTLHALLGIHADAESDVELSAESPVSADFLVVDEFSMVDQNLAAILMQSVPQKTKLLFVGDANQLPSVGAGNVFREMIQSERIPTTRLHLVFRQSGTSRIALNANLMQEDNTRLNFGDDFRMLELKKTEDTQDLQQAAADVVCDQYLEAVKSHGVANVQILAPFRNRGAVSVHSLNERLHDMINPPAPEKTEWSVGLRLFRVGDRVLHMKNTEEASNGDIGQITSITKDEDGEMYLRVDFGDGRVKQYTKDDLDMLELAYAMTVHKSQGSEYHTAIIPMLSSFWIMLRRNLLYTAITRAKKAVILVGEKKAVNIAIHKNDVDDRNTKLAEKINTIYQSITQ